MKKQTMPPEPIAELHTEHAADATEFERSVLDAARKQAQQMLAAARKEAQANYNALVTEGAGDTVAAYRTVADAALRRTVASAKQQNRQKLLVYRNQLVNGVFAEVEENLIQFCETPAYAEYLAKTAAHFAPQVAGGGTVRLRAADFQHKPLLSELLPACNFELDPTIRIGGIKFGTAHVLYDETLDDKLRSQRSDFLTRCGLRVE